MSSISPAAARVPADGRALRLSRLGDELLARQAARGSNRAFTALYERYHQPLYRYCGSIVRDDADAQDALQSTFTSALAALQRDGRNAPLRPWLYRIAHNESISLLRRRKRDAPQDGGSETAAVGASAEEEAAARARWQRVVEDLAELPERQRGSLLLRELAGLSHEEIALTFGTSVGAAKQAIFEARQGLAELQEGREMSCVEVRQRISEGDRRLLRGRRVNAHLRDCAACGAFAAAIPARESDLRALAPLPPAAAAVVLSQVIRRVSLHTGASAGSAASAAGIGKTAGTVIGWKALATAGVLATTAAGVTGLTHLLHHASAAPARSVAPAALLKPPGHPVAAPSRATSSDRPAARPRAATVKQSAAPGHHRSSATAAGSARHPHFASHSHRAAHSHHSSSGSNAGPIVSGAASKSQGGGSYSAPGQLTNQGVRRHGSAANTHRPSVQTHSPPRSYRSTPTHAAGHTRTAQTRSTGSTSLHSRPSTSAVTGGSAPAVSHTPVSSSTPLTVTTAHPVTSSASK